LEEKPHALVELAALLEQQAFVRDLLRQALAEAVLVARQQALAVEDAAALELGQLALEVDAFAVEGPRQLPAMELPAEHGGDLHHALGRRPEPVEPRRDHLLHRARDADLLERAGELPRAAVRDPVALLDERAHDLPGAAGAAPGPGAEEALEPAGQR